VNCGQLSYDSFPLLVGAKLNALLHHIRGKFVLRQGQKLACDNLDYLGPILWLPVLDDMLSYIVAILICDQHRRALMQLLQDCGLIMGFAVFQNSLNNSTAVGVRGENVHLSFEGFDDELNVLSWDTLNGFLHNVIAILIFNTLQNIDLQLFN
jgi:hypothetical protein